MLAAMDGKRQGSCSTGAAVGRNWHRAAMLGMQVQDDPVSQPDTDGRTACFRWLLRWRPHRVHQLCDLR